VARPIYDAGDVVQDFRRTIRPALVGRIGAIEPFLAAEMADAFESWLREVVNDTLQATPLNSPTGKLRRQLMGGIRVTGRRSLRTMRGRIWTQPWVFSHEYGATINPKQRFIAVPFAYGVHPDGRAKFRSPNAWRRYGSFVKAHTDGRKFIVYASGGQLKYLYVLVEEVRIPARLGLNRMADSQLGGLLADFAQRFLKYAMPALDIDHYPGVRL